MKSPVIIGKIHPPPPPPQFCSLRAFGYNLLNPAPKSSNMRFAAKRTFSRFASKPNSFCARGLGDSKTRRLPVPPPLSFPHKRESSPMHNGKTPVRLPVPQGLCGLYSYLKYLLKTVHFFSAVQLRNRRGMGLVEVLLAAGLSVLVFSGTHKALMLSVKTSRVVTSELAERELKQAVGMALGEEASCKANLIPRADLPSTIPESPNKGLYGTKTTRDSGAGEVLNLDAGTVSLRRGFEIKGDLRIVKMELRQWDKTPADPEKRVFVVWYEKLHLGPAEEGKSCTAGSQASDQDGCYFSRCELKYKLNTAKDGAETCQIVGGDCAGVSVAGGGGGGPPPCYLLDSAEPGKTIVGCGHGETPPIGERATAIGFEAGKLNTGANNVFIGYQAGKKVTTGANNVFIGYEAGAKVTTGANNIAIGADVAFPTESNQINIGGIIKVKQEQIKIRDPDDPEGETKQIEGRIIKLCDADGNCKGVRSGNSNICPTGEFVQEIKEDGTVICAPACTGGQKLFETLQYVDPDGHTRYGYYEVGNRPSDLRDFDPNLGFSVTRSCACSDEQGWLNGNCITCAGDTRWVWNDRKCMTCSGGASWRKLLYPPTYKRYGYSCRCPTGTIKKKVAQCILV